MSDLELEEEVEEEPYVEYDIATYPSDSTIEVLRNMRKEGDIIIPDFQRKYVWKIEQASLLVESFFAWTPSPAAIFLR